MPATKPENVPFKPHFGAFVLETLTIGMYGESRNAIREYIQNSFDSLRQAVKDGLLAPGEMRVDVTLDVPGSEMIIRDNGAGLRTTSAVEVLASVGASRKDFRKNAGFRGIGRLAGIVFCDTLTFSTKAKSDKKITTVVFDARKLRDLLQPDGQHGDAADTLEQCVSATVEFADDTEDHFFEVRLKGFHYPPKECIDIEALKNYLAQVSPLPYAEAFPFRQKILDKARTIGREIETIRLFVRDGTGDFQELFKPYKDTYSVKRIKAPLSDIDFVISESGKWWGWIGRKKASGAIKDADTRGIRVRVRNIQIDGIEVMRDIFARSFEEGKPRTSYARFVEWYVGEIFVEPSAAVPNARRDGFEEDENWINLRQELDVAVGGKYGRLAYRVSATEQISVATITARLDELEASTQRLSADTSDWDQVSPVMAEAKEIQSRINKASTVADDQEGLALFNLAKRLGAVKHKLNTIAPRPLAPVDCQPQIADAESKVIQRIFRALREGLGPSEWLRARAIVTEETGEEPE